MAEVLARLSVGGLGLVCLLQVGAIVLCALAWRALLPGSPLVALAASRAIRDGTSSVLAIVPGLGEAAGIRAAVVLGAPAAAATASGIVDLAAEILSQCLFTIAGVAALAALPGPAEPGRGAALLAGAAIPTAALLGLLGTTTGQRLLGRWLSRLAAAAAPVAGRAGSEVAADLGALAADRLRVGTSTAIHLVAWLVGAAQVWAAAAALGHPLSAAASLALASLVHAVRGVFFVVPWGAGVQEAGFVAAGAIVGMDEPTALALSLVTRARDLVLGLPAIGLWAILEARAASRQAGTVRAGSGGR